jgi:hypothetical protein
MGCEEKSPRIFTDEKRISSVFIREDPWPKFAIQNLEEMSISSKQFEEIHTKSDAVNIAITRHRVGYKNRRVGDLH